MSKRRKIARDHDRSRPVPLTEVVNFGPVTLEELDALGIHHLHQLEELGVEAMMELWVEAYPDRLNANAALGLIATIESGISWTDASDAMRARSRRLVNEMRRQRGLPVKGDKSRAL